MTSGVQARDRATANQGVLRALFLMVVVGSLAGLAPSCSGSNGGDGMQSTPCIEFSSTAIPAPLTVTASDGDSGDCALLYVDLTVTDVDDLFAANFVVSYPSDRVAFRNVSAAGSILSANNTAVDVKASVTGTGEVTVGLTRVGATEGVNVVGGQRLARLTFVRIASSGSGQLSFTTGELLNSGDPAPPPQIIPNTIWLGGTIGIYQL